MGALVGVACCDQGGYAQDAFGTFLAVGNWVECTEHATNLTGLGKVKDVQDGTAVFEWPGLGSYVYGMKEIMYYGVRVAMADVVGRRLCPGDFVTSSDGRQGIVREVTPKDGMFAQKHVTQFGIRVIVDRKRACDKGCV
mmetsp:Transcript_109211/g.315567  ORF Transcript_109211/g.315567 Transcript_109211/m.315567 type:complete len:139 (+) Transcript_109211:76-492(+)